MATSDTEIANLALSHLAISTEIASLTERSKEAQACNRFYAQARDEVLRDFPWPFATQIAALALVTDYTTVTDPVPEWAYAYRVPADCITVRRLLSGSRLDTRDTRVPFRIQQDSAGQLLFTDLQNAQLEYTLQITDPTRFAPDFVTALAYLLAGYIAPRVTTVNVLQLRDTALKLYAMQLAKAKGSAANEEQPDIEPDSDFITCR